MTEHIKKYLATPNPELAAWFPFSNIWTGCDGKCPPDRSIHRCPCPYAKTLFDLCKNKLSRKAQKSISLAIAFHLSPSSSSSSSDSSSALDPPSSTIPTRSSPAATVAKAVAKVLADNQVSLEKHSSSTFAPSSFTPSTPSGSRHGSEVKDIQMKSKKRKRGPKDDEAAGFPPSPLRPSALSSKSATSSRSPGPFIRPEAGNDSHVGEIQQVKEKRKRGSKSGTSVSPTPPLGPSAASSASEPSSSSIISPSTAAPLIVKKARKPRKGKSKKEESSDEEGVSGEKEPKTTAQVLNSLPAPSPTHDMKSSVASHTPQGIRTTDTHTHLSQAQRRSTPDDLDPARSGIGPSRAVSGYYDPTQWDVYPPVISPPLPRPAPTSTSSRRRKRARSRTASSSTPSSNDSRPRYHLRSAVPARRASRHQSQALEDTSLDPSPPQQRGSSPILVIGQEEYPVERVVDSRRQNRNKLEFKVEWKGYYGADRYSWLPFERAKYLIALEPFFAANPQKPGGPKEPVV
ncbi:hypothetical protein L202_06243 [Cryptococcus amylolentus CBS 6039]|uniref:Chromo domain-containing protein n=1 Tax=Cryptococcus amylolentus CBS 6039 TaxID=1295533 RepID=A0A1E3HKQ9_9TREE|nr:hypothetical protein L202_06243 [Cryptococcus amylolentus CBS 6039]ODN76316.1 hypothetical protein L202_06243 [Cryptococcus amylolentus CBS 6039]